MAVSRAQVCCPQRSRAARIRHRRRPKTRHRNQKRTTRLALRTVARSCALVCSGRERTTNRSRSPEAATVQYDSSLGQLLDDVASNGQGACQPIELGDHQGVAATAGCQRLAPTRRGPGPTVTSESAINDLETLPPVMSKFAINRRPNSRSKPRAQRSPSLGRRMDGRHSEGVRVQCCRG